MHKDLPAIFARNPRLWHDALGAVSLCVTFVGVLFLPGFL
jgi:hypothetical protein